MKKSLKKCVWFQLSVSEKNFIYSSKLCLSRQKTYYDFSVCINTKLQVDYSNLSCLAYLPINSFNKLGCFFAFKYSKLGNFVAY